METCDSNRRTEFIKLSKAFLKSMRHKFNSLKTNFFFVSYNIESICKSLPSLKISQKYHAPFMITNPNSKLI